MLYLNKIILFGTPCDNLELSTVVSSFSLSLSAIDITVKYPGPTYTTDCGTSTAHTFTFWNAETGASENDWVSYDETFEMVAFTPSKAVLERALG